ncbi:3'-5' exonuclease [Ohtaekwangia kribbensis]|jgi:DNA polymerase elongation subunit (family B)|uniref:3'-5' exonuclease n=1 Tax=Ohtaekwangia kribbensis TaxID=688913 RepID=A0ABW3K8K0_9BACT
MNSELREILFLDIETVSHTYDFNSLDERLKSLWTRKASHLRRDPNQTDEQIYLDRAAIFAEFGKVICICVGKLYEAENGVVTLRTKAYYGDDEKALLTEFKCMLEKLNASTERLCAHNGKEFDFPYLCRRMLVNGIQLPAILNISGRKPWEVQHYDTMELWKFGDYKHFTSLDLLAAIFNIPSSKNGIDGSKVNQVYYEEKDLARIKDYCLRDVEVLAQLFLKLRGIHLEHELVVQTS